MNNSDVRVGIQRAWDVLDSIHLGEAFSTPVPLAVNTMFRDAALDPDTTYASLYELGLSESHYNILLKDLAYLQFSLSEPDHVRYAYFPNPFISGNRKAAAKLAGWREMVEAEMLDQEEMSTLISALTTTATVPVIRYENAPSQHIQLRHPCSHLHIGFHSQNRWPIARVLTPLVFTLWIVKQYYGEAWSFKNNGNTPSGNDLDQTLIAERQNCAQLGQDLFTNVERSSIHLS